MNIQDAIKTGAFIKRKDWKVNFKLGAENDYTAMNAILLNHGQVMLRTDDILADDWVVENREWTPFEKKE
jgi:hypothetical protein